MGSAMTGTTASAATSTPATAARRRGRIGTGSAPIVPVKALKTGHAVRPGANVLKLFTAISYGFS
jgi:hypothetical protein